MKCTVITYNDGDLNSKTVESKKSLKKVCEEEYKKLLGTYEDLDECQISKWSRDGVETPDEGSDKVTPFASMGATIDYCMGHEYIYEISVKVTAV